jgi:hypothetical protein
VLALDVYPASTNNYTTGRAVDVTQGVLHTMVGSIGSARSTFQSDTLASPRSAHYGVPIADGAAVERYVPESSTAWHAGNWPVNQRSIGVEHEDLMLYDDPRPASLYVKSAELVAAISARHSIPLVLTHDVEAPGWLPHWVATSTHCPGTLDVDTIIAMARGEAGVFDPINVQSDRDWLDQRVRDLAVGEEFVAFAVYLALGRETGNIPPRAAKMIRDARARIAARPRKIARVKRSTPRQVSAGHGAGIDAPPRRLTRAH